MWEGIEGPAIGVAGTAIGAGVTYLIGDLRARVWGIKVGKEISANKNRIPKTKKQNSKSP